MRFKYGSIGAESDAGIPYWIFYVLPRMFPDKLPGPGGYASLGVAMGAGPGAAGRASPRRSSASRAWRNNCAVCHTRELPHASSTRIPIFVAAGPGHT